MIPTVPPKLGSLWQFEYYNPTLFESETSPWGRALPIFSTVLIIELPKIIQRSYTYRVKVLVCGSGEVGWLSSSWITGKDDDGSAQMINIAGEENE